MELNTWTKELSWRITIWKNVLPLGVLTGSRAFNCATEKSDWDIVILQSNLPNYTAAEDYQCTNFNHDELVGPIDGGKPGYDLSEFSEFEDESFIEYDQ